MRRIVLAPLILALSSPAFAGIPESLKPTKWMKINQAWMIDTEDVELKGSKFRFYVERRATKDEVGERDYIASYVGKLRLRCSDFSSKIEVRYENPPFGSYYQGGAWEKIRPDMMAYQLANYFCFLSGVEGYTREGEEEYVGLGIQMSSDQKTGNIVINRVIKDSPAAKSGVMQGDELISIDDWSMKGLGIDKALQLMKGEEGEKVSIVIQRTNELDKIKFSFKREKITIDEPDWVKKIIKTVQSKPVIEERTGRTNCDSPVWRNRPECFDY